MTNDELERMANRVADILLDRYEQALMKRIEVMAASIQPYDPMRESIANMIEAGSSGPEWSHK